MINLDRIAPKTRGGYPVKVAGYNLEAEVEFQILGWIYKDNKWIRWGWYKSGAYYSKGKNDYDLIELPEYKEGQVWHNGNTLYFVRQHVIDTKLRVTTNRGQVLAISDIPETATLVFDHDEKGIEL